MKILAFDLGGTAVKYAEIDGSCRIEEGGSIPTPYAGRDALLDKLQEIYSRYRDRVEGISVSMPGFIGSENGYARTSGALTYLQRQPMAQLLSERMDGKNVYVENDGKCAMLAEIWKGNLRDCRNAAVLLLGTGLGGGLMIDGKLYKGRNFTAGEFSFINCTTRPLTERSQMAAFLCGATGLIDMAERRSGETGLNGRSIFARIHDGDAVMKAVLDEYAWQVANFIFNLNAALDLERVALGGGISQQACLLEAIQRSARKHLKSDLLMNYGPALGFPEIVQCKFYNDSNMIGALYHYLMRQGAVTRE